MHVDWLQRWFRINACFASLGLKLEGLKVKRRDPHFNKVRDKVRDRMQRKICRSEGKIKRRTEFLTERWAEEDEAVRSSRRLQNEPPLGIANQLITSHSGFTESSVY